jgi:hypothetical protein
MKRFAFFGIMLFVFAGCIKHYKRTTTVCNGKFYVEIYNVNPAGVDVAYLTDSLTINFCVGKFDNEHEVFSFICDNDSIIINKLAKVDMSGKWSNIETRTFDIDDLKKGRIESKSWREAPKN